MAHEIETAWMGGDVAAWWDRQRNFVQAELMTPEEAWEKGGINWPVKLVPVDYLGEETDYRLLVRETDKKVLNCVTSSYSPLQNWALMEFLMAVTRAGHDLKIESAMSLKEGKVVAICARRPEPVKIADEKHLQYLTGANWHGGAHRSALIYASNVRTVCANTLRFGIESAPNVFRFRHVGNIEDRIREAQHTLEMSFEYQDRVAAIGNELALKPMSAKEFEAFLTKVVPVDSDAEQKEITRVMNTRDGIRRVYQDTPDLANIHGKAWGALQAVAAYSDHGVNYQSNDNRFVAALTQDNHNQRAFDVLRKEYQIA